MPDHADDAAKPSKFEELPANMQVLIEEVGFPDFDLTEEEQAVFDRIKEGHCMMCNQDLGDESLITVNRFGIIAMFCKPQCEQDMGALYFLQHAVQDINDKVDFREGNADGTNAG